MEIHKYEDGFVISIEGDELVLSPGAFRQFVATINRGDEAPIGWATSFVLDPDDDDEDVPDTSFSIQDDED